MDLEDVTDSKHMHGLAEQTINATEDNVEQSIQPEEPTLPDLLIDWFLWLSVIIWTILNVRHWLVTCVSFEYN